MGGGGAGGCGSETRSSDGARPATGRGGPTSLPFTPTQPCGVPSAPPSQAGKRRIAMIASSLEPAAPLPLGPARSRAAKPTPRSLPRRRLRRGACTRAPLLRHIRLDPHISCPPHLHTSKRTLATNGRVVNEEVVKLSLLPHTHLHTAAEPITPSIFGGNDRPWRLHACRLTT